MPTEFVDMLWRYRRKGSNPAILTLYRHADPDRLAQAGQDLGRLTCPSLVLWGERDPFLSTKFAQAFADALPDSEMDLVPGAGHWPWIDDARVIDRVVDFVGRPPEQS
jgi:pimeloyl-ACP methyl ester carboxylesterase